MEHPAHPCESCTSLPVTRRGFLAKSLAAILGFLLITIPVTIGGVFFADPLFRRKKRDGESIRVTSLDSIPDDGTPAKFVIRADVVDAWTKNPDQPIGSVYLRKVGGEVIAFNTVCPHLGCSVDYTTRSPEEDADDEELADGAATGSFWCPCHESAFKLDGSRLNRVPPRDLDTLKTDIKDGDVYVTFQNFQSGTEAKIPV